jgi:hypothetical protein
MYSLPEDEGMALLEYEDLKSVARLRDQYTKLHSIKRYNDDHDQLFLRLLQESSFVCSIDCCVHCFFMLHASTD